MPKDYLPTKLERLKKLYDGALPDSNLRLMLDYFRFRENEGLRPDTLINDVKAMTIFSKCTKVPVESMTLDDLYTFFDFIGGGSKATADLYKIKIRGFLDFAGRKDLAEKIHIKRSKASGKLPEDLLTTEDIEKMIDACQNLRDRAFIAFLFESGARRGEVIELKLKHVVFDEYGAIVTLPKGKTGARRIRAVWSSGYLRAWIESHPIRTNREAFLWASFREPEKAAEYSTMWEVLKNTGKRAGIHKRVNPHSLRHAAATQLAKHLTEQELKIALGWTQGSSMAQVYVHLSGKDIDKAMLRAAGIQTEETENEDILKTIKCPRCKEIQDEKASFCFKCGLPLKEETSIVIENDKSTISKKFLLSALADPDVQAMLKNINK